MGTPYCTSSPGGGSPCGSSLLPNYQVARYQWVLQLLPAREWTLSVPVSGDNRGVQGNIATGARAYYTATIHNLAGTTAILNNSPSFEPYTAGPAHVVCWQQPQELSFAARDDDGDELEYTLDSPLTDCDTPTNYLSYAASGGLIPVGPAASACSAQVPGSSFNYSPTFPLPSFTLSGPACPALRTATPSFQFNARTGSFWFTPVIYQAQAPELNRYTVACTISEYRRINGVRTLVGTTRQEKTILVVDCGTNQPPAIPMAEAGNTNSGVKLINTPDSTFVQVSSCNYTRVLIRFSDPNSTDLLTVINPGYDPYTSQPTPNSWFSNLPLDAGIFQVVGNGTNQPVGILEMQADVAFTGVTYKLPLRIQDNACPVRGERNRILIVKIVPRNVASIEPVGTPVAAVCAGASLQLKAKSGRADSVIVFPGYPSTGSGRPASYRYQWAPANGLNPADQSSQSITVAPTQTTRYRVRVTATDFRLQPAPTCVDTASLLVAVLPNPVAPLITQVGSALLSSTATGNQWYLDGQPIAGATAARYTPSIAGMYTLTTTAQTGCTSPFSDPYEYLLASRVQVVPNPIADGRLVVQLTGYQQPVVLTVLDALGRPVAASTVSAPNPAGTTQVLDMSHTTTGVYMLRVVTSTGMEMQRVMRK